MTQISAGLDQWLMARLISTLPTQPAVCSEDCSRNVSSKSLKTRAYPIPNGLMQPSVMASRNESGYDNSIVII